MADPESRSGARYASAPLLDYVARVHAPHDEALASAFTSPERDGLPSIMVGPSEGRLVQLMLRMVGARKVVEVGTLAGYSAIWIARALPHDGVLYTIDSDPKAVEVARRNIAAAGLADRVQVLLGDAVSVLDDLTSEGPFCAVFVDADKARYDVYGRWARAHVRAGGLLIGDNAFFFGDLLDTEKSAASAMRRFHEECAEGFDSVCVPTPDGLVVGLKRPEDA